MNGSKTDSDLKMNLSLPALFNSELKTGLWLPTLSFKGDRK